VGSTVSAGNNIQITASENNATITGANIVAGVPSLCYEAKSSAIKRRMNEHAVIEMRGGPSQATISRHLQIALGCYRKERWW
jgi:hypothetical protein